MSFKFCPECGFKFDKEYKFCPECGFKLAEKEKKPEPLFDFSEDTAKYADDKFGGFDEQFEKQNVKNTEEKEARKAEALRRYNEEENFDKNLYIEFAEEGDPRFQYILGSCYDYSEKDKKMALYWYEKAAAQGDAEAQYYLGYSYYFGYGVTADKRKAKCLWEKAAAQGNNPAIRALKEKRF